MLTVYMYAVSFYKFILFFMIDQTTDETAEDKRVYAFGSLKK